MGALHQIERSQGVEITQHAQTALNNVRAALAQLQAQPQSHPAVAAAMEAVALSLGHVHTLSKMAAQSFPPPAAKAAPAPQPQAAPAPAYVAPAPAPAPVAAPQPAHAAPAAAAAAGRAAQPFAAAADPFAAPGRGNFEPAAQMYKPTPQPGPVPARPSNPVPAPAPPAGQVQVINADLGAHSQTNFYKGLAGNDIIDHGGLFISTYMVPKIGAPLRLKVSLPGGYEFEANAVVRWAREVSGVGDAPPGFGAQFTQISAEAKQLIYRYVRNREPLFYDDL
jgi:hypothetical protein